MANQMSVPTQQIGNYMASQMQSLRPRHFDPELQEARNTMQQKMDLKEHSRRLQQQSDSRRRAAVMEMMRRQWAAEVAWTTR